MRKRWIFTALLAVFLVALFVLRSGSDEPVSNPVIVFTQAPADINSLPMETEMAAPDYRQARIVSLNLDQSGEEPTILTPDLYSASSPSLSFDNRRIVFSAKEAEDDPWQIWQMNLDGPGQMKMVEGG